jgi:hypothetical protein
MANKTLESLVLRGSTVLMGGTAGNPRLGASYAANGKPPAVRISLRHPSLDYGQEFQPVRRPDHADHLCMDSMAATGAGRSHCRAGVLSRRSHAIAALGVVACEGGPKSSTVMRLCLPQAGDMTFGIEGTSGRLGWCKPTTQTSSASTWGFGVR